MSGPPSTSSPPSQPAAVPLTPQPRPQSRRPAPAAGEPATTRDLTTRHAGVQVAIGAATAAAVVAVASSHRAEPVVAVLLSIAVLWLGVLSAIDAAQQRLPNRITLPLAGATTLSVVTGGVVHSNPGAALGAVGIGLAFATVFFVMGFGMGDVKLALTVGMIAGWLGRNAVVTTALIGAITGAAVALALIVTHRRRDLTFGFGPFLAIGSVAGMLVAGT